MNIDRVTIQVPIAPIFRARLEDGEDVCMAGSIQSMVGVLPKVRYVEDRVEVSFSQEDWSKMRVWYGRKWRSNVTHEMRRHLRERGMKGDFKNLTVLQ